MRIAMIGQKGIPARFGGIERHVESLAVRLGSLGHEVIVYTRAWYAAPKTRFSKGVRTMAAPTIKTKHLDAIAHTLTSTFDAIRNGADIIHYHGVGPSLLSWIPRLLAPRIKVVATFHCIDRKHQKWGVFPRLMLGLGEWAACRFPHETVVVSKTLQSYCDNRYNRDTRYIPNGIAAPGRPKSDLIKKFGVQKDGYLLMVSRLVRHKGAHYLIEAYDRLERRGLTQDKKLVIVGGSAFTDDYVEELKKLSKKNRGVILTGALSGKPLAQLYANAYAVVHPSESEGLPIAVLEAMSHGKTVIASDIPENMEVTREHGINFRNKSVADLEKKLRYALAHPDQIAKKGASARSFVLANYQWDDAVKTLVGLYESLTRQKPARIHRPAIKTSRA